MHRIDEKTDFIAALAMTHPGLSGVMALTDGREAFAARVRMVDSAARCIDCQYYIWRNDMSGTLLLEALRRAANRGVRVRLLLDDHNTDGMDAMLSSLDSQPNFEVRLFNPHRLRHWRLLGLLADFARLNRRMHNKSFTVDGVATIVGGRNVGDEYFGANQDLSFIDLDILAVGAVAGGVARDFERYWNSNSAVPVARLLPAIGEASQDALRRVSESVIRSSDARAYIEDIRDSRFARDLRAETLPLEWVSARLVSDPPAKGLALIGRRKLMLRRLRRILGAPRRELLLISAYFVPTRRGMRLLLGHARRGVKITVLTNSLEATDVAAVHAGYARYRNALLEAGVGLYEMKRRARRPAAKVRRGGESSSSNSSLHAKAFSVDHDRVFVGSFNFDARSVRLNTEMGLVIKSRRLAEFLAGEVATDRFQRDAYSVRIGPSGRIEWIERTGRGEIVHTHEPSASWGRRVLVRALSLLRIDWLL